MIWFLCTLVLILLALAIYYRNYEKLLVDEERKKGNRFAPILPMGLALYDKIAPLDPERSEEESKARAVYIGENPALKIRLIGAKRVCIFWIGLLLAACLGIASILFPAGDKVVEELPRPEFGETSSYRLEVEGLESEPVTVQVSVSGREPDEGGMQELFDEIAVSLKSEMLGKNDSLDEVRYDLSLPSVADYGIRVTWKSLNPEIISDQGRLTAQDVPEEGLLAVLEASLSYSVYHCSYEIPLRVVPEEEGTYRLGLLEEEMIKRDGQSPREAAVALPRELDGSRLYFRKGAVSPLPAAAALLLMAALFLVISDKQRLKEAYEKRNVQLLLSYRSLVFELGLMLGCGMTIRGAWYRILAEYEKEGREERKYLLEEMLQTKNEIDAGMGEGSAYAAFGRRCAQQCYIRLGNELQQNLRQGVAGLPLLMEKELEKALEQRKNQMLKEGELMETKMLFPMFLLLALVMAVLIAPAIISIA